MNEDLSQIITHVLQILDDGVEELFVVDEPVGDVRHRGRVLVILGVSIAAAGFRPRVGGRRLLQLGQPRRDGSPDAVGQVRLVLK